MESGAKKKLSNELSRASSPYLLEHADNPVHWMEWGSEALNRARSEDKPLLVSIGYAACHWCHVMARESFMNAEISALMNEHFVCIKVDREERPDLDQIYMEACQHISGRGGWPLNAFALPDGRAFHAVTYLPQTQLKTVLDMAAGLYRQDREKLVARAEAVSARIVPTIPDEADGDVPAGDAEFSALIDRWATFVDPRYGGFGQAQKFPLPSALEFLMQAHHFSSRPEPRQWVVKAMDTMAASGLRDHLGGGFYRYCVDRAWRVPHFEKMLYDNAQLVSLYAHAYQLTGDEEYGRVVLDTVSFLERELYDESGGFYSSLNADSGGEEGLFYTWTHDEVSQLLDADLCSLAVEYYQIQAGGNWEEGRNILLPLRSDQAFALQKGLTDGEWREIGKRVREVLLGARGRRVRPSTDDKLLTAWNALMISAYVDAAKAFGDDVFRERAAGLALFLLDNMSLPDGGLWRSRFRGQAKIHGFLDDYALTARGLIDLYCISFERLWLDRAEQLVRYVLAHFGSEGAPFFFYSSDLHHDSLPRLYEFDDQVMPASNSVMAGVLFDLGRLLDQPSYIQKSQAMVQLMRASIMSKGPYMANWARLMLRMNAEAEEMVIVGDRARAFALDLQRGYQPFTLFAGGEDEDLPLLRQRKVDGKTMLYHCRNRTCAAPREVS